MDKITDKVLVVDDEESIRKLIQRILNKAGYDVITAADGGEALSKVEGSDIGVMILDMKMPGLTGMEVLQETTARWPDICVLMLTAVDDLNTAVEAMKSGAYDYITKPFNRDDLIVKLQKAIEQRNLAVKTEAGINNLAETWPTGLHLEDWVEKQDEAG